jgi:hypothetical protein
MMLFWGFLVTSVWDYSSFKTVGLPLGWLCVPMEAEALDHVKGNHHSRAMSLSPVHRDA